jgi:hypothetical protein
MYGRNTMGTKSEVNSKRCLIPGRSGTWLTSVGKPELVHDCSDPEDVFRSVDNILLVISVRYNKLLVQESGNYKYTSVAVEDK